MRQVVLCLYLAGMASSLQAGVTFVYVAKSMLEIGTIEGAPAIPRPLEIVLNQIRGQERQSGNDTRFFYMNPGANAQTADPLVEFEPWNGRAQRIHPPRVTENSMDRLYVLSDTVEKKNGVWMIDDVTRLESKVVSPSAKTYASFAKLREKGRPARELSVVVQTCGSRGCVSHDQFNEFAWTLRETLNAPYSVVATFNADLPAESPTQPGFWRQTFRGIYLASAALIAIPLTILGIEYAAGAETLTMSPMKMISLLLGLSTAGVASTGVNVVLEENEKRRESNGAELDVRRFQLLVNRPRGNSQVIDTKAITFSELSQSLLNDPRFKKIGGNNCVLSRSTLIHREYTSGVRKLHFYL